MNPGDLEASVEGDIEKVERTIKISEIRVRYRCAFPKDKRETVERVMEIHPAGCPAHQSVKEGIRIKIEGDFDWR